MIPIANVLTIVLCTTVIGFFIGMVYFDPRKVDQEDEYSANCTKSKHLFSLKPHPVDNLVYCFCGNETLKTDKLHEYLIVKM